MRTISATQFKQHCLQILEDVDPEGIIITQRGRPVARLMPIDDGKTSAHLIGSMKGLLHIQGDILSTGVDWDAESGLVDFPKLTHSSVGTRRVSC